MKKQELKKAKLPNKPGVYFFKKGKDVLYIGKATSLRDRVKSYFSRDLIATRGPLLLDMVVQADKVEHRVTDSVLEALILEASLIKKYQPKYNTREKDNKSWNYICITKGEIPLILTIRGRILKKENYNSVYGPFTNGSQLKEAMKIIRRIFPFVDEQSSKKNNKEFYRQLGLIPEVFSPLLTKEGTEGRFLINSPFPGPLLTKERGIKEYKNNIKNLKLFFEGKKKKIVINFRKEMMMFAKKKEFEKANEIKRKIFALEHINDVSLIKDEITFTSIPQNFRIEAYDIAHLSGKNMVGVMTVIEDGEIAKHEYKKFIIRTQSNANDTGALEEVLSRRFRHTEWGLPNLIIMDGGTAQVNIAKIVLNRYQFKIPIVSVIKDDRHKAKAIMGDEEIIKKHKKDILLVNSEAHRFAIAFHKQKRNKSFLA